MVYLCFKFNQVNSGLSNLKQYNLPKPLVHFTSVMNEFYKCSYIKYFFFLALTLFITKTSTLGII